MRIIFAAAAALTLITTASAAGAIDNCSQTRQITTKFGEDRTLIVTATSIPGPVAPEGGGDNCRNATAVLTVHTSEGVLVDAYAAAVVAASYDLGHTEEPVPAAKLGAFLDEWIKLDISTTDKAPAATDDGVTTTLSAEDFEAMKTSKAPMFCFKESAFDTACYAPDSSGYIIDFFEREET